MIQMSSLMPNKSPEPTAVGAVCSAIAVHVASRRWLSFLRRPLHAFMKRDMDVIRYILLQKEAEQEIVGEKDVIVYHIGLLIQAGLIEAVTRNDHLGVISDAWI